VLRSYIDRIDDVLKSPAEQDKSKVRQAGRLSGAIELENVSFQYGPSRSTVQDLSLKVAPGQLVAIVGRRAGKSTLTKRAGTLSTDVGPRAL
jgi:ABC-type bacteriocin/lantibiotic exporter with double-glycine peptidase domain